MTAATCSPGPLVLLDRGANFTGSPGLMVHWAELEVPPGHESLPALVEEQGRSLRQDFLAWVHDLGEHRVKGRTLREHLRLDGPVSFWWLTSIAEKDPAKVTEIYLVWKLAALERLYEASGCWGLVLCSTDARLHRVLSAWCRRLSHPYRWVRDGAPVALPARSWRQALPQPLQGLGTLLKRLWTRRRHLQAVNLAPAEGRQATVVTCFPNIDLTKARQGIFHSHQWGELHRLLDNGPRQVNWIWLYVASDECSFGEALDLRRRFAAATGGRARYFFLEEFITAGVLLRAMRLYLRLIRRGFALRAARRAFHFAGSALNFWPLLAPAWRSSFSGSAAMDNCLLLETFRNLAAQLPSQDWGLYLWENQPWERALVAAWQGAGHGPLLGFQHSTLRFLDLRFFEDPRSYRLMVDPPPLPERLAVNGSGAWSLLEQVGFPANRQVMVEATRYQYLDGALGTMLHRGVRPDSLLVVTGYLVSETEAQLRLLARVAKQENNAGFDKILVKPHPYCPVEEILRRVAPELIVEVVHEPLARLWFRAVAVYAANSTSASLEAAYLGLPVLVHLVEDSFNLSPLLDSQAVKHVRTVADLREGLKSLEPAKVAANYFCLEEGLPRWRNLLES